MNLPITTYTVKLNLAGSICGRSNSGAEKSVATRQVRVLLQMITDSLVDALRKGAHRSLLKPFAPLVEYPMNKDNT
jgi:hypothetical protein